MKTWLQVKNAWKTKESKLKDSGVDIAHETDLMIVLMLVYALKESLEVPHRIEYRDEKDLTFIQH